MPNISHSVLKFFNYFLLGGAGCGGGGGGKYSFPVQPYCFPINTYESFKQNKNIFQPTVPILHFM